MRAALESGDERADLYPVVRDGLEAHRTADGGYLITAEGHTLQTEEYLIRFLELANGKRSARDIESRFSKELGPLFGPLLAQRAYNGAVMSGLCEAAPDPTPELRGLRRVTGSDESYRPLHATFEIIETCNFTCSHCYYSSSPFKRGRMTLELAIKTMDKLAEEGMRAIELTGGECTIHPDFLAILHHASKTFKLVAIISNGYLLGTQPNLLREVASLPNVVVQISIDGLEETHDLWRRHKGSFMAAARAARGLAELGTVVRMASVISEENVHQVRDLFELAASLGVAALSLSPVAALGRGCNISEPGKGSKELVEKINDALAPFWEHPLLRRPLPSKSIGRGRAVPNCGAGSRTYAIDYDGEVRACSFSRDSKKFGNILSDSPDSIFGQTANHLFRNAPSPGGKECEGCKYYHYCRGCFVKAFMTSENHYPECAWRQRWFPNMGLGKDTAPQMLSKATLPVLGETSKPQIHYCGCADASKKPDVPSDLVQLRV